MDHVTDVIFFGAIKPCTKCKHGKFIFGNSTYLCTGNISEWAKCDNVVKEPPRTAVKIPQFIRDQNSFLAKKFKVQTRAVKDIPVYMSAKAVVKKNGKDDIDA